MSSAGRYVDGDTITTATLDDARERCVALDQRAHLTEGARTWPVFYDGGQRGQMTRLPSGRGAVCFGADSLWGWWGEDALRVDPNDDGTSWAYREDGEVVYYDGDEEDGE